MTDKRILDLITEVQATLTARQRDAIKVVAETKKKKRNSQ